MIFPNKLQQGDVIATTAVSFGCGNDDDILRMENAFNKLKEQGFDCKETKNSRSLEKLQSSSAMDRANQFMELIEDNSVKAIIAVSGGEILMEMLPYLDFDKIKKSNSKWIQGYSDPSLLNYLITTKLNIATINSVNFKSFGMEPWHETVAKNIEFFKDPKDLIQKNFEMFEGERVETITPYDCYALNEKVEYKSLYNGQTNVKGRVIGGCIDVLRLALGTSFDNTVKFCNQFDEGMLWYIDNCELNIAEFFRVIWQLKQAHWFDNANGFLIGRTAVKKEMFDFSYEDSLHKAFDDLNVPVFYDIDIGHLPPQWIMVNGSFGEFEFNNGKGELIQKMI